MTTPLLQKTASAFASTHHWTKAASSSSSLSSKITTRSLARSFSSFHHTTTSPKLTRVQQIENNKRPETSRCHFQSKADFRNWRIQVQESAFRPSPQENAAEGAITKMEPLDLPTSAPFLHSVSPMADQLLLAGVADATPLSPRDSLLECTYPLASNEILRYSVADFSHWSAFRLGKFYELVDALTADVAYRHAAGGGDEVALVTAGHYHSRKYARTELHKDVTLRSYVTKVGRSSLEVRTDGWQDDNLVNVCHTIMVALDPESMKPLSRVGKALPPLVVETPDDEFRTELAGQHEQIRQNRSQTTMQLRNKVSAPPNLEEMQALHQLHRHRTLQREGRLDDTNCSTNDKELPTVQEYTFRSSRVIFPEQRNVHGKLFGGFVMAEAQSLAQYAANFFGMGTEVVPMGIDEAVFLQPVALGDMVTFTARLVHATATTCRVNLTVEVRDPAIPHKVPQRSNRLLFVFGGDFRPGIIPETYQEILMHMDARRRHEVEGPWDEEVECILSNQQEEPPAISS